MLAAFLTLSANLPGSREGARSTLMVFVVAEVGTAICGLVGFAGIRRGYVFWISIRSTIGVLAAVAGTFSILRFAAFAGSGP